MRRAVGYVMGGGSPEWCAAMHNVVIAVMIEKKASMDDLAAILKVPGVDMLQFGPTDYSVSIGIPGKGGTPEVQDVQKRMVDMALKAGKHPRVEIGSSEQADPWLKLGVKLFCVGWDVTTIFRWCKEQGAAMHKLLGVDPAAAKPAEGGYTKDK